MAGWASQAIFDKVSIASIGVAVQSGIPGTLRNSQGEVTVDDGVEPSIADSTGHCGISRKELEICRRARACGESSAA
jgi:hypothetical protein